MAVTTIQAQNLLTTGTNFLLRVQYAMVTTAVSVAAEATNTALHPARKTLSVAILNNPSAYVQMFAQAVVSQLTLGTTNLVGGVTDTDTTDASLATLCSSVYNDFFVS